MTQAHHKVTLQRPSRMLTTAAIQHAEQAIEEKSGYLQYLAIVWLKLHKHSASNETYAHGARAIVGETLLSATQDEWKRSRIVLQRSLALVSAGNSPIDKLHDQVEVQLEYYCVEKAHWRVVVGMMEQEPKLKLRQHLLWREKTVQEARTTCSRAEAEAMLQTLGFAGDSARTGTGSPMIWEDPRRIYPRLRAWLRLTFQRGKGKAQWRQREQTERWRAARKLNLRECNYSLR